MKNSQTNKVSEETREREARAQQIGSRPTKVNRALKVNGIL
jgi:DNA-binding LacI/PurR family transcriptional regulator